MGTLPRPTLDPTVVFRTCVGGVQRNELRSRLSAIVSNVEQAGLAYDDAGTTARFYSLPEHLSVGAVSAAELAGVYTLRMARKNSAGRVFYDKLMSVPTNDRCPSCDQRRTATLDHYLPVSKFPVLAVMPANLVPSCSDCNKSKTDYVADNPANQLIHPYFDDFDSGRWLYGQVTEKSPPSIRFFVDPPADWDTTSRHRIKNHFEQLKLGRLYAANASDEIASIRSQMIRLAASVGAPAIKRHLEECALSREAASINSWRSATYRALAENNWYQTGGYSSE